MLPYTALRSLYHVSTAVPIGGRHLKPKKIIALLLACFMAIGLTGCIGNFYEYALTVDGTEVSSGLYLLMQLNAIREAENKIDEERTKDKPAPADDSSASSQPAEEPEEINVFKETIDGKNGKQWVQDRALEMVRRYVLVDRLCYEKEITLDEEASSYIQQTMQYWQYMEETYTANGISQETYLRYLANESLSQLLMFNLYAEDGDLAPTNKEIMDLYTEQNAHIRFISIPVNTSGDAPADKTPDVEKFAAEMVKALEGGKTMEEVAKEMLPSIYKTLETDFDAEKSAEHVSTTFIKYDQPDSETYSQEFLAELQKQKVGSFGFTNMGSTVMVYEKIEVFENEESFTAMRNDVISSLYTEDFDKYLASIYDTFEVKFRFGAQWYLRPTKIKDA